MKKIVIGMITLLALLTVSMEIESFAYDDHAAPGIAIESGETTVVAEEPVTDTALHFKDSVEMMRFGNLMVKPSYQILALPEHNLGIFRPPIHS